MAERLSPILFSMTTPATGAFPCLFVARAFKDKNGREDPKKGKSFGLVTLFKPDHPDLPGIRARMIEAATRAWPNMNFTDRTRPDFVEVKWPLKSGDAEADKAKRESPPKDHEYMRGYLVLRANTGEQYPPGLGAVMNGELKDVPTDPEGRAACSRFFYGGMDCLVDFSFKTYEPPLGPGINAYLQVVSSLSRGERDPKLEAGAGRSATAAHGEHVRGHVSSTDPRGAAAAGGAAGLP